MNKLRVIDAKRFEKLLFALDFKKARQKGSHIFLQTCRRKIYYFTTP